MLEIHSPLPPDNVGDTPNDSLSAKARLAGRKEAILAYRDQMLSGTVAKADVARALGVTGAHLAVMIRRYALLPPEAIGPRGGFPNNDPDIVIAVGKALRGARVADLARRLHMPYTSLMYYVQKAKRAAKDKVPDGPEDSTPAG